MADRIYIIELPNKPPREVTGIKFDVISERVEKLGGKIYPKPEPKPVPYVNTVASTKPTKPTYMWSEVVAIAEHIRDKYFSHSETCMTIPIRLGRRTTRRLGLCRMRWDYTDKTKVATAIELSKEVVNGRSTDKLEQVIYHEFVHVEFPNEGHRGMNFRNKEFHNPYRKNKSRRLTCVS